MQRKKNFDQDMLVSFVRIGQDRQVPVLALSAGSFEAVRDTIHTFVEARLGTSQFVIQLWTDHGFIDLGTHSAGSFIIRPAPPTPENAPQAPARPPA